MERNQELFERIEGYLNDNLSSEERNDFEHEVKTDPKLKKELELHRSLHNEMKDTEGLVFRKKLEGIARDLKKKKRNVLPWRVAATILVMSGLVVFFWFQQNSDTTDLFEKYYRVYPVEDVIRGGNQNEIQKVLENYRDGKFEQIIPVLTQFASDEPNNQILKMYLGNALLQTNQTEKALDIFLNVSSDSSSYEEAQWYLALTYVRFDEFDKASRTLERVIEYKGVHKKNAETLLDELKR